MASSVATGVATFVAARAVDRAIVKNKEKVANPITTNPGLVNSMDLQKMNFESFGLTGELKLLFGDQENPFHILLSGLPGSGKSTFVIYMVHQLALNNNKKTLYLTAEEGARGTTKKRFTNLKAFHPNITITGELQKDDVYKQFDLIVMDSVNHLGIKIDEFKRLIKFGNENKISFLFIFQARKDGTYKLSSEYGHEVDSVVMMNNGNVEIGKNRGGLPVIDFNIFDEIYKRKQA